MVDHRDKYEEFALEILITILETKKPKSTIEMAMELSGKKGDKEIVTKLSTALMLIEEGRSVLESFYYADLLTDETFRLFQLADDQKALDESLIKDRTEDKKNLNKLKSSVMSGLIQPFLLIALASLAAVFLSTRTIPVLKEFYKNNVMPEYLSPFLFIDQHPFIGFLAIFFTASVIAVAVIFVTFNKLGKKNMDIYKMSSIVKLLRSIGLNYNDIFLRLYEMETDQFLSKLYRTAYSNVQSGNLNLAINEIAQHMPTGIAIILFDKVSHGDDEVGWQYVTDRMKAAAFQKIDAFSKIMPIISYMLLMAVILFSMIPIGEVAMKALELMGGA